MNILEEYITVSLWNTYLPVYTFKSNLGSQILLQQNEEEVDTGKKTKMSTSSISAKL